MCFTVRQTYGSCDAVIYAHDYCHEYIEHTRRQVDNKPCPEHVSFDRHFKDSVCDCALYAGRDCIIDVGYEKGIKHRFEVEKDPYRFRHNERLAWAERARLAEEQKELDRNAERKEEVAKFMKKRRRIEEYGAWNAKFEEVNQGIQNIKMEGDVDMEDSGGADGIKTEPHSEGGANLSVKAPSRGRRQGERRTQPGYNNSTASTMADAGGG